MTHPGVEMIRTFMADAGLGAGTLVERRDALDRGAASSEPPRGVRVRRAELGGRRAEWIHPDGGRDDAVVLYLHGGGYCIGSLDTHRDLAARLAVATGTTVVTLDYRLAPEHPFPAAVDDACAAYRELVEGGTPPGRIAVAGDSAGGGLTIAMLVALRSEGLPLPAAAVCLSPWVDLTQTAPTFESLAGEDPMVTKEGLDEMADAYLAGADPRSELASPLFAESLGGLPPVHIEVGACELLLDDSRRLADRIRVDGGSATVTVWPELVHVFQAFPGSMVPEADESVAAVGHFIADRLGPTD